MAEFPVFDGHNDLGWAAHKHAGHSTNGLGHDAPHGRFHTDIPRLRRGGVAAQFWSVYVDAALPESQAVAATLEQIDFVYRLIEAYPDDLAYAWSADDVRAAWNAGKIASLIGAEGGHSINNSLGILRILARLGVRYLTLTHNFTLDWADSATDAPRHGGLTNFGLNVVAEMNKLGMLVDLSHVAPSVMHAALDHSTKPVIFSHSSARALADHPRNIPDDALARLSTNGGIAMTTFVPAFISAEYNAWEQAGKVGPAPHVGVEIVADHIEHAREVAGIDHIGLGGDYDGVDSLPVGLTDVSTYPRIFDELTKRGWSRADLLKLANENMLRVLADA